MNPDLVINDIKDAPVEYMQVLKDYGIPLIGLDDTGEASSMVDVLIDANVAEDTLYIMHGGPKRCYGPKYMILNSDFAMRNDRPRAIREKVEKRNDPHGRKRSRKRD